MRAYPLPDSGLPANHERSRLTEEQRIEIYALKKAGFSQRVVATEIGVHKSTVH